MFLLFLMPLLSNCQADIKVTASKYPAQVGDINFDKKIDDPDFKRCIPENKHGYQYYNDSKGFQYKGEKLAIIRNLEKENIQSSKDINGYVTIRFVVNCEGKAGIFRMKQMDENYIEKELDKSLSNQLLDFTKKLNGWIPKEIDGQKADYYQYLTFKIEHGKVSEILP